MCCQHQQLNVAMTNLLAGNRMCSLLISVRSLMPRYQHCAETDKECNTRPDKEFIHFRKARGKKTALSRMDFSYFSILEATCLAQASHVSAMLYILLIASVVLW